MLLVKGKNGKSNILDLIDTHSKAITFVYYNQALILNSMWYNSSTMSFKDFMFELRKYIQENLENSDERYDYLIIYTNQGEITIKHQKELFQKWENIYGFQVIIGCQ